LFYLTVIALVARITHTHESYSHHVIAVSIVAVNTFTEVNGTLTVRT